MHTIFSGEKTLILFQTIKIGAILITDFPAPFFLQIILLSALSFCHLHNKYRFEIIINYFTMETCTQTFQNDYANQKLSWFDLHNRTKIIVRVDVHEPNNFGHI